MVAEIERCSVLSAGAGEPLAGTAAHAPHGYLMIEDDGPWGPKGLTECSLDAALARQVEAAAGAAGVKVMLFRAPGSRRRVMTSRRIIAARITGDREMVELTVDQPQALLAVNWSWFAPDHGAPIAPLAGAQPVDGPRMFVCTHARRDQCCALDGRALATFVHEKAPGDVLECSHLGGHRFAATALLLPMGVVYGRLTGSVALDAMESARDGRLIVERMRGLSHLSGPAQAADQAAREHLDLAGIDAVQVDSTAAPTQDDPATYRIELTVTGPVPAQWVAVVRETTGDPIIQSCGADPKSATSYVVEHLRRA